MFCSSDSISRDSKMNRSQKKLVRSIADCEGRDVQGNRKLRSMRRSEPRSKFLKLRSRRVSQTQCLSYTNRAICPMVATLATVSREPGQALTGAAISGVTLCEGCRHRTDAIASRFPARFYDFT